MSVKSVANALVWVNTIDYPISILCITKDLNILPQESQL